MQCMWAGIREAGESTPIMSRTFLIYHLRKIKKRSRAEAGQNGHSTTAGDADSSESSDDDGAFARRSEG
jgi:hypothetical protein